MRTAVSLVVALALSVPLFARTPESTARWLADLAFLKNEAPRRHPKLFHNIAPEQWNAMIEKLGANVPALEDFEIEVEVSRIIAALGPRDGHTRVNFFNPDLHFRFLPVAFYVYADGMFVRAAAKPYAAIAGARVVRIGTTSAGDALAAARAVCSGDNSWSNLADAERALSISEVLRATKIAPGKPDGPVDVTVALADGTQRTVSVTPIASLDGVEWTDIRWTKPALYLRGASHDPFARHTAERNFWFEFLPDSSLLYVNFSVVADAKDETVAKFFDRVFDFAGHHDVKKFVIDVRANGGGNNYLNRPIVYGLIKRDQTIGKRGTLFAIIGRETFSAAQNLVNSLDMHTEAIFVGEPSGGAPNHFGDSLRLVLPNSKLTINLASVWWQDLDPRDQRLWTAPGIAADLSSSDEAEGRDPALEAIIRYRPEVPLADRVREALPGGKETTIAAVTAWRSEPANKYRNGESDLNALAAQLYGENRVQDAITVFAVNAAVNPGSWLAHQSLGRALAAADQKDAALAELRRALEIRPNAPETLAAMDRLK